MCIHSLFPGSCARGLSCDAQHVAAVDVEQTKRRSSRDHARRSVRDDEGAAGMPVRAAQFSMILPMSVSRVTTMRTGTWHALSRASASSGR